MPTPANQGLAIPPRQVTAFLLSQGAEVTALGPLPVPSREKTQGLQPYRKPPELYVQASDLATQQQIKRSLQTGLGPYPLV